MGDNDKTVTLPHYVLEHAVLTVDLEGRWKLVERLIESEGHTRNEIPEVWAESPLQAWCWLILTVNEIKFDPDIPKPLCVYGIDLGFVSDTVNKWIWTIS
jgi:hypothetical protein